MKKILLIAGEPSGDALAADLVQQLREKKTACQYFGMGGTTMQNSGVQLLVDASHLAIVGLTEIFSKYKELHRAFNILKNFIRQEKPELVICIDYPGFNLRMARFAKKNGCKTLFYVSPQIWAWRYHRIKTIKRYVDHMAVLFPFEKKIYQAENVPCTYVGHPLLKTAVSHLSKAAARELFSLDPNKKTVGLLPGSRKQEIEKLLPTLIKTADLLLQKNPNLQFILPKAKSLGDNLFATLPQHIHCVSNQFYEVLRACDAVIAASGTVTFEVALMKVPMVIIYKMSPFSFYLAKKLVRIPYVGLCNIVAEQCIAKELLQTAATPEAIANEIQSLLSDTDYREKILTSLTNFKNNLLAAPQNHSIAETTAELLS